MSDENLYKLTFLIIDMVTGKVVQFRRGKRTVHERHMLVEVPGCANKEKAEKFIGKEVEWKSPAGKLIKGKVAGAHGNNGVLRVIFEKGLPGQSVGTEVEVK